MMYWQYVFEVSATNVICTRSYCMHVLVMMKVVSQYTHTTNLKYWLEQELKHQNSSLKWYLASVQFCIAARYHIDYNVFNAIIRALPQFQYHMTIILTQNGAWIRSARAFSFCQEIVTKETYRYAKDALASTSVWILWEIMPLGTFFKSRKVPIPNNNNATYLSHNVFGVNWLIR